MTVWRPTCAQAVSIKCDHISMKITDSKMYVLVADSTGITATGKGKWRDLKWNIKCNFIKLHILADEESQKILEIRQATYNNITIRASLNYTTCQQVYGSSENYCV